MATTTLPNRRRYTAEHLAAYRRGITKVVYSSAPYEGWEVEYSPRSKNDASPWVLAKAESAFRFNGRECHVETMRFQVVAKGHRFAVVDSHNGDYELMESMSFYAAQDQADRYEENPVLAMELTLTAARGIRTGEVIVSGTEGAKVESAYTEEHTSGDVTWIRTSGRMEHDYDANEVFYVGTFRKGPVA